MRKIFTFLFAALMSVSMFADPNILTPTISGDLSFTESTTVTMECTSPNADIYYTTDGVTDPRCDCAAAPEYTQPITITETTVIKAAAFDGNDWSAVAEVTFTKVPAPAEPQFDLRYENKWLRVTPKELGVNYFVFIEDKEYYDNRYQQYDQTTMQNYLDYVVGVVVSMGTKSSFEYNGDLNLNPDPIYHTWYDNDHLLINHDYVAFVFKIENDARVGDVEFLAFTYAGEPEQEEGIEHIVLTEKAQKVVVDGMIYIVRDGKLFNLTGAQVR